MRNKEYGKRLRELRHEAGLNQEQLASQLKDRYGTQITQSYVSHMERAGKIPTGDVIADLARLLRTSSDYLLGLRDDPAPAGSLVPLESPISRKVALIVEGLPVAKQREILDVLKAMESHR